MIGRILRYAGFRLSQLRIRSGSSAISAGTKGFNEEEIGGARAALRPFHDYYVSAISRPDMAASLELSALLDNISRQNGFKRLLDMGSGFSSFVFRKYAAENRDVRVFSVDDDSIWLNKTRSYLTDQNVPLDGLLLLNEFIRSNESNFNLILLDLNFVEVRKNYIGLVVERCKPGGLILFDDVHKREFMTEVLRQTRDLPVRLYGLKSFTLDGYGRFALLGVKDMK